MNSDGRFRTIVLVSSHHSHPLDDTHTRVYPSENCMFPIQPWQWLQGDKELTPIGIRTRICHADHSRTSVLEILGDFVLKLSTVYAFSTPSSPRRITPLDHKVTDDPMKNCSIVVSRGGKCGQIVAGPWSMLIIEFNAEGPNVCFELDVCIWRCCHVDISDKMCQKSIDPMMADLCSALYGLSTVDRMDELIVDVMGGSKL